MEKLIKENLIYIALVLLIFVGGLYGAITLGSDLQANISELDSKKQELETKKQNLQLEEEKARQKAEKKEPESGKVIYEVSGQQFSPEASFGIMFENVLANITNSGVRIRQIDYNYSPSEDKVLDAKVPGYNSCELSFLTVGTYAQLQTFFKNIAKEKYLSSIREIYLEPYELDRTILIAKFKIRLYTRTI